ncbi:CBS domain-containing protein CBSX1 chloroplastic isoform X3 [Tripterygium wilfordii]|uniref:CBS domain-containing protein CBSX1 chloroplastic isoform X3 n=1 Tax=Tripterygium wilfordii TaxID=458696 RepID=A0A7J7CPZ2_TRIWF|nr:CBS domain-containing protein CBSX1, chloroplastic-like [Tripterygium wilfordii]KAF5736172.1 CBS domain-containing protein CBSX1 chloroplastic isoform X3 [Tripterygium wilfordii]
MNSIIHAQPISLMRLHATSSSTSASSRHPQLWLLSSRSCCVPIPLSASSFAAASDRILQPWRPFPIAASATVMDNSVSPRSGVYTVGDFMTRKEDLRVVKATTTVDEALETLVEYRITGFPVIDDNWKLVGLVSDYDLLALDSISGRRSDNDMFPEVDSTWKTFNEVQKLLSKTNGKLVGEVMTPAPLVVRETTNLEDAARLLLETKYRRLPVVDADGKLVGIITRGNVVRAALQIKRDYENKA